MRMRSSANELHSTFGPVPAPHRGTTWAISTPSGSATAVARAMVRRVVEARLKQADVLTRESRLLGQLLDQLGGQASKVAHLPVSPTRLKDYVLPLHVPQLAESLAKRLPPGSTGGVRSGDIQKPDPRDLPRLLRLRRERRGEERGRPSKERAAVDHSIT